ncbi:flagellar export chaperone FliS [Chitinimonas sp. JJ19]|uniref:flagellar export chaperone FliS n=1 Tax=Chitinimonas sp. JJ19 TaxID=3109352 RepID=UPI0030027FD5
MATPIRNALDAYGKGGLEYEIDTASPHKLICMLYDGAIKAILQAKAFIGGDMIAAKGSAISKAIAIIEEGLRVSLDKTAGGELAENLDGLYEYMSARLLEANLRNDVAALDEVHGLLNQLKSAWEEIEQNRVATLAAATPQVNEGKPEQRVPLSYGRV